MKNQIIVFGFPEKRLLWSAASAMYESNHKNDWWKKVGVFIFLGKKIDRRTKFMANMNAIVHINEER